VAICFVLNAFSFLALLTALALMRPEELFAPRTAVRSRVIEGILEGFRYVRRTPNVRFVVILIAVLTVFSVTFNAVLPLLASDTLDGDAGTLGLLTAVFGAGSAAGALITATVGRANWRAFVTAVGLYGIALLVLAPLDSAIACSVLLFVVGIGFTMWTTQANSLIQLGAPDHLRGRVISIYLMAYIGLTPVSSLLAGWLVDVGGTMLAFLVGGAAAVAVAGLALVHGRAPEPEPEAVVTA
jgi:MFS family permease